MTTTADPATRPTVSLPALNVSDRELRAEDQWVAGHVPADAPADQRAKIAARLEAQVDRSLRKARADRDRAAYTVHTQYRVRRGGGLADALGVGRTRWQKIKETQTAKGGDLIEDAAERLPGLAHRTAILTYRHDAVLAARDAAIIELRGGGWSRARIAAWIGRDPSRISHVLNRTPEAAAS